MAWLRNVSTLWRAEGCERKLPNFQHRSPRLNFRDFENVVNHAEQMFSAGVNGIEIISLTGDSGSPRDQRSKVADMPMMQVRGVRNSLAHGGQKFAFSPGSPIALPPGHRANLGCAQ